MKRRLASILAAGVLATAIAGPAIAAPADPYRGLWAAIDVDGSHMLIAFLGRGPNRTLLWLDDDTTVCGGGPSLITGRGPVVGDSLTSTVSVHCANGTSVAPIEVTWTYDGGANVLDDSVGVVWHRL